MNIDEKIEKYLNESTSISYTSQEKKLMKQMASKHGWIYDPESDGVCNFTTGRYSVDIMKERSSKGNIYIYNITKDGDYPAGDGKSNPFSEKYDLDELKNVLDKSLK